MQDILKKFDMPTPKNLLLVDDLLEVVAQSNLAYKTKLIREKVAVLKQCVSKNQSVELHTMQSLIESLAQEMGPRKNAYDILIGVSSAGTKIAKNLISRESLFDRTPQFFSVNIGHIFTGTFDIQWRYSRADYQINEKDLRSISGKNILLCDDTLFSGNTLQFLLQQIECKENTIDVSVANAIETSAAELTNVGVQRVFSGKILPGRPALDSNSINIKDLFDPNALRIADNKNLPLIKMKHWMRAWFGGNHVLLDRTCEELHDLLQPLWQLET